MPFSTVGYSESQDSAVLIEIAALADGNHVAVSGDDVFVPGFASYLFGYHFLGANFTLGQIQSPSLRQQLYIDVEPADLADEPASPSAVHIFPGDPLRLDVNEGLRTRMAEDGAGATRVSAFLWLGSGVISRVGGNIYTIRCTNTDTLTANVWSNGALTFSQTLRAGRYQIVGARAQSAGLRHFRTVFPGAHPYRPGAPGYDSDGDLDNQIFRRGGLGVWGDFDSRLPPSVDFMSASADSSQVVHLDLVPI